VDSKISLFIRMMQYRDIGHAPTPDLSLISEDYGEGIHLTVMCCTDG